jgi:hypothetical protein
MSNKHFASEMLVGPASLPHPPAQRYAPFVCVAKYVDHLLDTNENNRVWALHNSLHVCHRDFCASWRLRCEKVDNEAMSTASQYRATRRHHLTQGVHVPKHSTVDSNACSIVHCAHKQERRSDGDRRLLSPPQWAISNTHNDHVHRHTFWTV